MLLLMLLLLMLMLMLLLRLMVQCRLLSHQRGIRILRLLLLLRVVMPVPILLVVFLLTHPHLMLPLHIPHPELLLLKRRPVLRRLSRGGSPLRRTSLIFLAAPLTNDDGVPNNRSGRRSIDAGTGRRAPRSQGLRTRHRIQMVLPPRRSRTPLSEVLQLFPREPFRLPQLFDLTLQLLCRLLERRRRLTASGTRHGGGNVSPRRRGSNGGCVRVDEVRDVDPLRSEVSLYRVRGDWVHGSVERSGGWAHRRVHHIGAVSRGGIIIFGVVTVRSS